MTTYFITRHPGAKQWAEEQGLAVDELVDHLDPQTIQPGDIVMGSLPVNLAAEVCARGGRYFHLTLELPADWRGRELTPGDMRHFGAKLEEYRVAAAGPTLPSPCPLPLGGGINASPHRGEVGRGEQRIKLPLPEELKQFARQLRSQLTDAEQLLWQALRQKRMAGYKFRRQHPVPPYVLDFYCHELRLAIELDGGQHLNNARDASRDAWLAGKGIRVLRYWNHDVLHRTESVLEDIWRIVSDAGSAFPPPGPLPAGGGASAAPRSPPLADESNPSSSHAAGGASHSSPHPAAGASHSSPQRGEAGRGEPLGPNTQHARTAKGSAGSKGSTRL